MDDLTNNPDAITDLFDVVTWGDIHRVMKVVKEDISAQTFRNVSSSLLHLAANNRHADIVEFLLNHRAYVDSLDANLTTPLMLAAHHGDVETVQILLAYAADVNAVDYDFRTPLYFAAYDGHIDCVNTILLQPNLDKSIVRKGGWTALHEAAKFGHEEVVVALLSSGVDLMARTDEFLMTPGHLAAASGKTECVKLLLDAGMNVNAVGGPDMTSTMLHEACRRGVSKECIQLLLDSGADIFMYDGDELPTHIACLQKHADTLDFLLTYAEEHGMPHLVDAFTKVDGNGNGGTLDRNINSNNRNNALNMASYLGLEDCVHVLLNHNACNTITRMGQTPEMLAVGNLHVNCLKLLLADLKKRKDLIAERRYSDLNPLLHLCGEGHKTLVQNRTVSAKFIACACLLLNSGLVDINHLVNNQSCLEVAVSTGAAELVQYLLSSGADPYFDHMLPSLKHRRYIGECCEIVEDAKCEPKSLLLLARIQLRKCLNDSGVSMDSIYELPLPRMLKDYVYHGHYNVGGLCNV